MINTTQLRGHTYAFLFLSMILGYTAFYSVANMDWERIFDFQESNMSRSISSNGHPVEFVANPVLSISVSR